MDLHRFRRNPSGLAPPRPAYSPPPVPGSPPSRHSQRHSDRLSASSNASSHAVYSPRAFHRLSTPSELSPRSSVADDQPPSPLSIFSLFSRVHSPFHPHDDHITEVDEASGHHTHDRRHSSLGTSPANLPTAHGARPAAGAGQHAPSGRRGTLDSRRRSSMQYSVGGTPSRLSGKWERKPCVSLGFIGWRPRKSQVRRACFWCGAVGLLVFCFSLVFVLPTDLQRLAPVVIGALLSFISALTILVSFLLQPQNRRYPNELLVYVALCEFGLAVLALSRVLTYCSDASYNCRALAFQACGAMSVLEMFLLLASVGWFGCAILHLFVSVSNPFANYKSQLKRYHLTVWGASILVSVVVPLSLFSEGSQRRFDMTGVEICRAVGLNFPLLPAFSTDDERDVRLGQWQTLNMEYWGTLFALVVLLVIAAQFILALGWWRSNSGTVIALKARRRMMKRMTTYVHTLNATWLLILVVFFTYRANAGALRHLAQISQVAQSQKTAAFTPVAMNTLDALFHFILAAKGYFTCVVWLAVNKHCCAVGRPMLCKDPFPRRGSESGASYSSDDDDEDDGGGEPHPFSLAQLGSRRGTELPTTAPIHSSTITASTSRPSGYTPTSLSFATVMNASAVSASGAASFASQNNETLQREIIYYTVCGITKSILKSSQQADADVFFQQLMVGADRESSLLTMTPHGDLMSPSPRAYCHAGSSLSLTSTVGVDASMTSSVGPNTSFATSLHSVREVSGSTGSRDEAFDGNHSGHSFSSNTSVSLPNRQRFSMYPVSHVPFELFEQEIELQSHRSSEASLSLSPIFANLRRTAHALYSSNAAAKSNGLTASGSREGASGVENPRPKMFIDYAPTEFRAIRKAFGLSDEMYLASFRSTAKERVSAGSSGAFMFFSGDNALIVKSMKEKECRKLVKMIPAYADYVTSHPKSRIIRFFGCHRIRLYGRNFYFVVMSNVLHSTAHTPTITEKYDVKGSWIDRQAKLPQTGDLVTCSECNATYVYGREDASTTYPFHVHRPDTVLKDLDLTRPLLMGRRVARELYEQLAMDCEFLNAMGIMDYSLLVGVHKCSHPEQPWARRDFLSNTSFLASGDILEDESDSDSDWDERGTGRGCGVHLEPISEDSDFPEEVYFVGIIDILQEWNWEKQLEKVGKTLIGKSSSGISAVAPDAYCQRFKARMAQVLRLVPTDERAEDARETKRLVKMPSIHPSASASMEDEPLEFQIQENEEDEDEAVDVVHDSTMDEALQFEEEAIAVSVDLENGRVSQRL